MFPKRTLLYNSTQFLIFFKEVFAIKPRIIEIVAPLLKLPALKPHPGQEEVSEELHPFIAPVGYDPRTRCLIEKAIGKVVKARARAERRKKLPDFHQALREVVSENNLPKEFTAGLQNRGIL